MYLARLLYLSSKTVVSNDTKNSFKSHKMLILRELWCITEDVKPTDIVQ